MFPSSSFWKKKRVLVTGHSGFKGAWLSLLLERLGAEVAGISLPPEGEPNLYELTGAGSSLYASYYCDVRDAPRVAELIRSARPDVVVHMAAQALVRRSYRSPVNTFDVNVMGTVNVLEACRDLPGLKSVVIVTTDKVYRNHEWEYPYRETDELGGHDPYSASKAAAELVVASYRDSFLRAGGVAVSTCRAGNVIGGGDWSEDRLIPDIVRAWESGSTLEVRSPGSVRPWQHVLEPLRGYLLLAEKTFHDPSLADSYNFGPGGEEATTVRDVVDFAAAHFDSLRVSMAQGGSSFHEANMLALDTSRSQRQLDYVPVWDTSSSISETMRWYKSFRQGSDARTLCIENINAYLRTCSTSVAK